MVIRPTIGIIKKTAMLGNRFSMNILERYRLMGTYFQQEVSLTYLKQSAGAREKVITKHPVFVTMQLMSQKLYWENNTYMVVNQRLYRDIINKELEKAMETLRLQYCEVYPQFRMLKEEIDRVETGYQKTQIQRLLSVQMKRLQGIRDEFAEQEEERLAEQRQVEKKRDDKDRESEKNLETTIQVLEQKAAERGAEGFPALWRQYLYKVQMEQNANSEMELEQRMLLFLNAFQEGSREERIEFRSFLADNETIILHHMDHGDGELVRLLEQNPKKLLELMESFYKEAVAREEAIKENVIREEAERQEPAVLKEPAMEGKEEYKGRKLQNLTDEQVQKIHEELLKGYAKLEQLHSLQQQNTDIGRQQSDFREEQPDIQENESGLEEKNQNIHIQNREDTVSEVLLSLESLLTTYVLQMQKELTNQAGHPPTDREASRQIWETSPYEGSILSGEYAVNMQRELIYRLTENISEEETRELTAYLRQQKVEEALLAEIEKATKEKIQQIEQRELPESGEVQEKRGYLQNLTDEQVQEIHEELLKAYTRLEQHRYLQQQLKAGERYQEAREQQPEPGEEYQEAEEQQSELKERYQELQNREDTVSEALVSLETVLTTYVLQMQKELTSQPDNSLTDRETTRQPEEIGQYGKNVFSEEHTVNMQRELIYRLTENISEEETRELTAYLRQQKVEEALLTEIEKATKEKIKQQIKQIEQQELPEGGEVQEKRGYLKNLTDSQVQEIHEELLKAYTRLEQQRYLQQQLKAGERYQEAREQQPEPGEEYQEAKEQQSELKERYQELQNREDTVEEALESLETVLTAYVLQMQKELTSQTDNPLTDRETIRQPEEISQYGKNVFSEEHTVNMQRELIYRLTENLSEEETRELTAYLRQQKVEESLLAEIEKATKEKIKQQIKQIEQQELPESGEVQEKRGYLQNLTDSQVQEIHEELLKAYTRLEQHRYLQQQLEAGERYQEAREQQPEPGEGYQNTKEQPEPGEGYQELQNLDNTVSETLESLEAVITAYVLQLQRLSSDSSQDLQMSQEGIRKNPEAGQYGRSFASEENSISTQRELVYRLTEHISEEETQELITYLRQQKLSETLLTEIEKTVEEQKRKHQLEESIDFFHGQVWKEKVSEYQSAGSERNGMRHLLGNAFGLLDKTSMGTSLSHFQETEAMRTSILTYVNQYSKTEQLKLFEEYIEKNPRYSDNEAGLSQLVENQAKDLRQRIQHATEKEVKEMFRYLLEKTDLEETDTLVSLLERQQRKEKSLLVARTAESLLTVQSEILEKPYDFVFQKQQLLNIVRHGKGQELLELIQYMSSNRLLDGRLRVVQDTKEIRSLMYQKIQSLTMEQTEEMARDMLPYILDIPENEAGMVLKNSLGPVWQRNSQGNALADADMVYRAQETREQGQKEIEEVVEQYVVSDRKETREIKKRQEQTIRQLSEQSEELQQMKTQLKEQAMIVEELKVKKSEPSVDHNRIYREMVAKMERDLHLERQRRGID